MKESIKYKSINFIFGKAKYVKMKYFTEYYYLNN